MILPRFTLLCERTKTQVTPALTSPTPHKYRDDIDGLRAIAVSAVILFHLWPERFTGGFLGVDIFFAISGFLITRILAAKRQGVHSLLQFYAKRIRRIIPGSLLMCFSVLLISFFLADQASFKSVGKQLVYSQLLAANHFMAQNASDYWGCASESIPFLHMWSLSVEEQFYLFYPLVFTVALPARKYQILLLILFGGSAYAAHAASITTPTTAFYYTFFRVWEFTLGGLVSFIRPPRLPAWVSPIAIITLFVSLYGLHDGMSLPFPGAVPAIGASLVLLLDKNNPSDIVTRLLSITPMRYAGRLSYSLYLWHWPAIVFQKTLALPQLVALAFLPIAVGSYHFVESPVRKRGNVLAILACSFVTLCLGALAGKGVVTSRFISSYEEPRVAGEAGEYDVQKYIDAGGIVVSPSSANTALVLGNSMAYQHAITFNRVLDDYRLEYWTVGGTPSRFLLPNEDGTDLTPPVTWTHSQRQIFDSVRRSRLEANPQVVIVSERWDASNHDERVAISNFLDYLHTHSGLLIILSETPNIDSPHGISMAAVAERFGTRGTDGTVWVNPTTEFLQRSSIANEWLKAFCSERIGTVFINLNEYFMKDGKVLFADTKHLFFGNLNHLSPAGSDRLEQAITHALPAD